MPLKPIGQDSSGTIEDTGVERSLAQPRRFAAAVSPSYPQFPVRPAYATCQHDYPL